MRYWPILLVSTVAASATMNASACGGSPAQPQPVSAHVDLTDPLGDVMTPPSGFIRPDLVGGSLDVEGDVITVRVRFGPGTFDPPNVTTFVYFDVDSAQSTGAFTAGDLGVDYWINVAGTQGSLNRCQGSLCPSIATVPVTILHDGWDAVISRTLLGNDDGRFDLRVHARVIFDGISPDYMPDLARPPVRVR